MRFELDRFDLDSIAPDATTAKSAEGTPLLLEVETIDEDPGQPRTESLDVGMQEMSKSIATRGVLQPVSVRRHPTVPGRWMLNFGARRLRASKKAGLKQIPAFINEGAEVYDQVIENEQRENLHPLEMAQFIQRRQSAGDKSIDIAKKLGKSPAFVTFLTALIDPPEWLLSVYHSGRCTSPSDLYELRKLSALAPSIVHKILAGDEPLTRSRIRSLVSEVPKEHSAATGAASGDAEHHVHPQREPVGESPAKLHPALPVERRGEGRPVGRKKRIIVEVHGKEAQLLCDVVPKRQGYFAVSGEEAAASTDVAGVEIRLLRIVESD